MSIEVDSTSSHVSGYQSWTQSHTMVTGSDNNRILLYVHKAQGGSGSIGATDVEYNGVPMNLLFQMGGSRYSNYMDISVWYLLDADLPGSSGAYDADGESPSEYGHDGYAIMLTGAKQEAPVLGGALTQESDVSSTSVDTDITAADSWLFDAMASWSTISADGDQTTRFSGAGSYVLGVSSLEDLSVEDDVTMSWTTTSSFVTIHQAFIIEGVSAGGPAPNALMLGMNF